MKLRDDFLRLSTARLCVLPLRSISLKSIRRAKTGNRKEAVWVRRFLFALWSFFVYLVFVNMENTKIGRFQYKIGIMIFVYFIDRFGLPNYNKVRMRTICKLGAELIEEMDRFIFDVILFFG